MYETRHKSKGTTPESKRGPFQRVESATAPNIATGLIRPLADSKQATVGTNAEVPVWNPAAGCCAAFSIRRGRPHRASPRCRGRSLVLADSKWPVSGPFGSQIFGHLLSTEHKI